MNSAKALDCDICGSKDMAEIFKKDGKSYYKCGSCGLEKIYPKPTAEDLSSIYDDKYYDAWGNWKADTVRDAKKDTFRQRLSLVPRKEKKNVLDCGCAAGYLMEAAQELGFVPFGIELNPVAVKAARNRFSGEQVRQGRLEEINFPENFFYAIFMNDFLEHLEDPLMGLRKANAMLEPGGYLVITTPDTCSFSRRLMGKSWPHYKTEHFFYFNRKNLSGLMDKAGFRLIGARRGRKCLTPDYIRSIFVKYPRPVITPLFRLLDLFPPAVKFKKMWFYFGEMTLIAQKI